MTRNEFEGEARNVVQAGEICGDVTFTAAADRNIGLAIMHETNEVVVELNDEMWLRLEVINRTARPRRLLLRLEGLPAHVATIVPGNVVELGANETATLDVVVRCTATEPTAGPRELRAVATDADSPNADREWWTSEPKKILVPANARLLAWMVPSDLMVSCVGTHQACVRMRNLGNTRLRGTLRVLDHFESEPRYLSWGRIDVGDDPAFDLRPDEQVDKHVEVLLPAPGRRDRRWRVPVVVEVGNDRDVRPVRDFEIVQGGVLMSVWRAMPEVKRRRSVAACVISLVVLSFLAGRVTQSDTSPLAESRASVGSSVPTVRAPEPTYEAMTGCTSDKRVTILKSLNYEDTRDHGWHYVEKEKGRLLSLAEEDSGLLRFHVHISKREKVCENVRRAWAPKADIVSFIWLDVVAAEEAGGLCERIGKPHIFDCFSLPAA